MGKPDYSVYAEIPPWYVLYFDRKWPQRKSSLKPLGTCDDIRGKIASAFPGIAWYGDCGEVHWRSGIAGSDEPGESGFTEFRLSCGDDRLCHSIGVSLFDKHSDQFHTLCEQQGWREFSDGLGLFTWRDRSSGSILLEAMFSRVRWKRESVFEKLARRLGFRKE